ncbi:MAG TPA: C-GCAxxG-C-C family protein [Anaeromyxobacteraceae bacterium]|nr:C-GCAxxG-C-C family protein [Anaeromyxobacteraceae bacterium]
MNEKPLSRRDVIVKAGLLLGGAGALGALPGCGNDKVVAAPAEPAATPGPQVADFPYQQHMPLLYQLSVAGVQEPAYHAYYAGGCCHGAYSALVGHLAQTAGAPFDLLPLDFGKFGGGGIAGYGSICGAVLGGVLVINMVVQDATARAAMMTELMRWYETAPVPAYVPAAVDVAEIGKTTLDFSAANMAALQVAPGSHLCHASVSKWCAAKGVSAKGADKLARCARLTADVAGKVAELINAYLKTGTYAAAAPDAATAACGVCHPATSTTKPVASGMACGSCHADKLVNHPAVVP